MSVLEQCISSGTPVILKDVGENLDHSLGPVLSRSYVVRGIACWIVQISLPLLAMPGIDQ